MHSPAQTMHPVFDSSVFAFFLCFNVVDGCVCVLECIPGTSAQTGFRRRVLFPVKDYARRLAPFLFLMLGNFVEIDAARLVELVCIYIPSGIVQIRF